MKNITREYLHGLYAQSLENVRSALGTKGAFAILFLKISLTLIAVMSLVSLGLLKNNEPAYEIVFAIFSGDIVGLFLLWISSPFIALWNMPKVAALKDKEQRERLEEIDPNLEKIFVEEYNDFLRKHVGIDIRNTVFDDFDGVIELISFTTFVVDERCNEHEWSDSLDLSNCHFESPRIKGKDHRVIGLAELENDRIIFLTEKTKPMILEFFFVRPEPIPVPEYIKMYFSLNFEIRGTLGKKPITRTYGCVITLNARKAKGAKEIEAEIEISGVERDYQNIKNDNP